MSGHFVVGVGHKSGNGEFTREFANIEDAIVSFKKEWTQIMESGRWKSRDLKDIQLSLSYVTKITIPVYPKSKKVVTKIAWMDYPTPNTTRVSQWDENLCSFRVEHFTIEAFCVESFSRKKSLAF